MFRIYAFTYSGKKIKNTVLDGEYAIQIFNQFIQSEDAKQVMLVNGLTGEVILNWEEGKIVYLKHVSFY